MTAYTCFQHWNFLSTYSGRWRNSEGSTKMRHYIGSTKWGHVGSDSPAPHIHLPHDIRQSAGNLNFFRNKIKRTFFNCNSATRASADSRHEWRFTKWIVTFHYITLHYIDSYSTLHYITLRYISVTLHSIRRISSRNNNPWNRIDQCFLSDSAALAISSLNRVFRISRFDIWHIFGYTFGRQIVTFCDN